MSVVQTRYGRMHIIDADNVVSRALALYGEWAMDELSLLAQIITPGMCVLDVGAFIGTHTLAFSEFVGQTGEVYSFEPRKKIYDILSKNLSINGIQNVTALNIGLAEKEQVLNLPTLDINQAINFGGLALDANENLLSPNTNQVRVLTIDGLEIKKIDVIKLDVEGMERKVLDGAINTILRDRPIILCECNGLKSGNEVLEFCQFAQYDTYGLLTSAFNHDNFNTIKENIFGNAKELELLLIPQEKCLETLRSISNVNLLHIANIEDLVLPLLNKPQYPSEVLVHTAPYLTLGINFPSPALIERDGQITNLNQAVSERDGQIINLNQAVSERDGQITNLNQALTERDVSIKSIIESNQEERAQIIFEFQNSFSWRVSKPIRLFWTFIRSVLFFLSKRFKKIAEPLSNINISDFTRALQLIRRGRLNELAFKIHTRFFLTHIERVKHKHLLESWQFLWPNGPQDFEAPSIKRFPVDIVISVHNGYEHITPLFESIRKNTTKGSYRLIVIDDCSSDKRVQAELERQKACFDKFELIKNDSNLGFIGSVNLAVQKVTSDIFILLNTDTEVPSGWLERMTEPFLMDKTIASVTPFSNSATICSFPNFLQDNNLYLGMSANQIDDAFRTLPNTSSELLIPTAVGFCMAINRNAVKRLGMFDPIYGRGYCEENDWCMRTASFGYKHLLKHNLFVYHKHGGSFSSLEKEELIKNNHQLLLSRYPKYHELVSEYIKLDPNKPIRQFVKLKLASIASDSGAVLIIDHDFGGGANAYRKELVAKYGKAGTPVLVLVDNMITNTLKIRASISEEEFDIDVPGLEKIETIFSQTKIGCVIYNNAVGSSKPQLLIQSITKLREKYSFELITLIHDFYSICPSYTLLNKNGVYCGVPEQINICSECIPNVSPKYSGFMHPGTIMSEWRRCWADFLKISDKVVCFSESSKLIILKAYPFLEQKIDVVPHVVNTPHLRKPAIKYDEPLHIGILGGINYAKGLNVVLSLVAEIRNRNDRLIKISVVGEVDAITPIKGLTVTGRYQKESLVEIIEDLGVNVFLLPSVCPETFSYVTSELIAMDVPLVCFDIGAPPERVRNYSKGCVLPIETDTATLLNTLITFKRRFEGLGV
jgi:FkbM family methyltransferase